MGVCLSTDERESPCTPCTLTNPNGSHKHKAVSLKRLASWSSFSFSPRDDHHSHKSHGRIFTNGATDIASLFTQQGEKGVNQDAMVVWENFASMTDTVFCGVFDGHGPFGHMVAKKVRDSLPSKLSSYRDLNFSSDDLEESSVSTVGSTTTDETFSSCLDEESGSKGSGEKIEYPENCATLKESFLKSFRAVDKELRVHSTIDCYGSGTTAVTLVKQGQDLVIGNVGDSRAILGTRDENDNLTALQLTVDLKPDLPREEERIKQCKGRIFSLHDEPKVPRVWMPNNDCPGLAMTRAFGDFCVKDFGVISVPEISYRRITERDEFVVLATDGIWDVLSNKEVVDIIASAPSQSCAAQSLVEAASRVWHSKYSASKIDDCAVVCLFLNTDPSNGLMSYTETKEHADFFSNT